MRTLMMGFVSIVLTLTCFSAEVGGLRVGAAKGNITPLLGKPIIGNFHPHPANHVHDDLWVRCMALDDGKTRIALVVCDLLGISSGLSLEVRRLVEEETGTPGNNIMISATHTHSANSALGDRYDLRRPPVLDEYQQSVARRIADTVRCAFNNLEPAQVGWNTAYAPEHVFNRRWFLKPGTAPKNPFGKNNDQVWMNPPVGSPNLERPAGPTDPEVYVLAARRPNGTPIATFSNYSLHYVGGKPGTEISADYYGVFNDRVKELLAADRDSPPFISIMSNGTSGDINNIDRINQAPKVKPYERMNQVAHDVACKVAIAYNTIQWRDHVKLGAAFEELELRWRRPTEEELEFARKTSAEFDTMSKADLEKITYAQRMSRTYAERIMQTNGLPESWRFPLQAFRIGDLGISTFPVEVFCEIGLEMKRRTPFKAGFSISLAHGYYGYMPTPDQIPLGGYETWVGTNRLEPQAAPKMVERLLTMQRKMLSN